MRGLTLRVDRVTLLRFYDGSFRRIKRIEAWQQAVAVGDLEQSSNAFGNADNAESAIGSLAGCEYADHAPESG